MMSEKHFIHPPFKLALRHFSFTLPGDWEVVGYRRDDRDGQFNFSSASGAQGQFSWRIVKAVPDIEPMIQEIHRRHLDVEAHPVIRYTRHGSKGVILGHTKLGERFYASVFNVAERCLNEWIFPSYSESAVAEVIPMLESYSDNLPDRAGRVFYAQFGLELSLPSEWILKEIDPYPAAVTLMFENSHRHKILAHRFGMAQLNMQGADVSSFYHRYLYGKRYAVRSVSSDEVSAYPGGRVTFKTRGKRGFDFVLGAWWRGEGTAFLLESENRIYAFEHIAQDRVKVREDVRDVFQRKLSEGRR